MRFVVVGTLVLASLAGCTFHRTPLLSKKGSGSATSSAGGAKTRSGDAGGKKGAASPMDAAAASLDAGLPGAMPDGSIAMRDEAGIGDGGTFGTNPTPTDPDAAKQSGGLQCGGVFCPFATDPIKPCCTTQGDVDKRAARSADRCGLDMSATGSDFFGTMCWQRDQSGVVDGTCPVVRTSGASEEPGCCSDQGVCGGVNTDHALGCHYDPSKSARSCGSANGDADAGASCDLLGTFGLRLEVDMSWGGRSGGLWALTDDGRGKLLVHLLATFDSIDPSTLELHGTAQPCGVELPAFYSTTLCEAYQPIFPTKMWDSSAMPRFAIGGHAQCLQPGCIVSIDAQTVLLGIQLSNPEAPWPTANDTPQLTCPAGKGVQCFPDHDGNQLPGLTVQVATQGTSTQGTGCSRTYRNTAAPLSASPAAIIGGVRRTDRVLLGVRMKVGGSAKLAESCSAGHGSGIAEFVNSRAWGCLVQPGTFNFPMYTPAGANDSCTSAEAAFMDANLPLYNVLAAGKAPASNLRLADVSKSQGPQVSLVRLGDTGAALNCAAARSASYP